MLANQVRTSGQYEVGAGWGGFRSVKGLVSFTLEVTGEDFGVKRRVLYLSHLSKSSITRYPIPKPNLSNRARATMPPYVNNLTNLPTLNPSLTRAESL